MAVKFATVNYTNFCSNDCLYCECSRDNWDLKRSRMTKDEILSHFRRGYKGGMKHFLLTGGTDLYFDDDKLVDIIKEIKTQFPDSILFSFFGEKYIQSYEKFKAAGVDGCLLPHRTANKEHFSKLHTMDMAGEFRMQTLFALKELGLQVGTGVTIGLPYQTPKTLAEDLTFLSELKPELITVEPFIPAPGTKFENEPRGDDEAVKEVWRQLTEMFPDSMVLRPKDFIEV